MTYFNRLLAITDFSENATMAARRAAMIAAEHHARLDLLHVMSGSALKSLHEFFGVSAENEIRLVAEAERQLDELAADIDRDDGLAPTTILKIGNVLDEVLAAADTADMLVLGAHGTSPLRDLLIGSMALRVLGKCRLPILVTNRPAATAYRRILVPVDFSPHSLAALKLAARIAPQADITVANAFEVPFESKLMLAGATEDQLRRYRSEAEQLALRNIRAMMMEVAGETRRLSHIVEQGDAAIFILEQAEDFNADLIVIGKHGQSLVEEMLLGSVTRHVLANAKCDVLVVHA